MHLGLGKLLPYFLYAAFIVCSFIAVVRPRIAVYLLAITLPLQHARYHLADFPLGGHAMDFLLIAAMIGVVTQGGTILPRSPLRLLVISLIVITYISLWVGMLLSPMVPAPLLLGDTPFGNWTMFVKLPILFLLVCATITTKKQIQAVLICLLISFLWVGKNLYREMEGRDTNADFSYNLREGGADFGGANGKAAYQLEGALCLMALLGTLPTKLTKLAALTGLVLGSYGVLFGYSRGAYAALVVAVFYLGIFKFRLLLPVMIAVLITAPAVLPKSVWDRIEMTYEGGQLDASSAKRLPVWQDAIATGSRSPVIGVGFNCFRYYRAGQTLLDTHNMYLKAFVETGVLGLSCLLLLWFKMFWAGHTLFRTATDPMLKMLGLGFAAAMIAVVIVNATGDRWTYLDVSSNTWILAGLVIQARTADTEIGDDSDLQEGLEAAEAGGDETPAAPMPLGV